MEGLIGLLPFAIFALACPLMMIFMMRGMHGGHGDQRGRSCHTTPADVDERSAPDGATARLEAMEKQIAGAPHQIADDVRRRFNEAAAYLEQAFALWRQHIEERASELKQWRATRRQSRSYVRRSRREWKLALRMLARLPVAA